MNQKRLAELFRERAALDLEIADAFSEEERKPPRKRPQAAPTVQPSQAALDRMSRKLRTA